VATYRGGAVSAEDLESWKRFRGHNGARLIELPLREQIEPVVLLRVLDRRFETLSPASKAQHALRWRFFKMTLAETRLRDAVRLEGAASEEEIRSAFEADPAAYALPRYWQLENILKRFPEAATPEQRARLRESMEQLRARVLAGEDFATLAKKESDSDTRVHGGNAGAASLDQLAPAVARVVADMKKGDVSPVIEIPGGLTLLRCTGIIEPQAPSIDRARRLVSLRLGGERFEKNWAALVARLDAELAAAYPAPDLLRGAASEVVATYQDGEARSPITREDFLLYLADAGYEPGALSAEDLRQRLQDRVRLEGIRKEADRRGLLAQKEDPDFLAWKEREMRARAVEKEQVEAAVPAPSPAEVRAAYDARPQDYTTPARTTVDALRIEVHRQRPRSFYEEARRIGERTAAGEMTFEEAAAALGPESERVALGAMTADGIWMMGANVDAAVQATPAGGTSRLVQEGRTLWILHVVARVPEKQLSFDEAQGLVRQSIWNAARRRAVAEFRRRLLDEQAVVLAR
jgi:parvulin-like peptidyl-prolyl cis-trans isomerase-like protein